ncbi:hypothetical protein HHK36_001997 [Tetracentron sinense]|uniref:Diacylglycerol kinase accessory domain-containing protein n=1 Tax=Tetracentron sinense TaxID=13715 RepID=A0A834ZTP1_TETSI|nr:hypothetical protein HHK36_001997 [Tetracentron sinense]
MGSRSLRFKGGEAECCIRPSLEESLGTIRCNEEEQIIIWWSTYRDLTSPFVDDGLLEVVGFRDAWHGLVLLAPNGHGTRLAQAHRIRFEFYKGAADHTFMRIDGEPWKQPLPVDDDTVVVEISHLGQVNMLATSACRSKSVHDPSTPTGHHDEDSNEEDSGEDLEERRKFGAADTFRIPDEIDMTHLS